MKKLIFVLFVLISQNAFSQSKIREFTMPFDATRCDAKGNLIEELDPNDNSKKKSIILGINSDWDFKVIKKTSTGYVLQFLSWGKKKKYDILNKEYYRDGTTNKYFFIDKETFLDYTQEREVKEPYSSFSFGTITLPIKFRFGNNDSTNSLKKRYFDFTGEVNLGLTAGVKLKHNETFSSHCLVGTSIASVNVDSFTTKGFVKETTKASSASVYTGYILEHDSGFQIGIFAGLDLISGAMGKSWVYNHQPWLGLGLGYSILQPKNKSKKQDISESE